MQNATTRRGHLPLLDGATMGCPRCKRRGPFTEFHKMDQIREYEEETAAVWKCPWCNWIFALADNQLLQRLLDMYFTRIEKLAQDRKEVAA